MDNEEIDEFTKKWLDLSNAQPNANPKDYKRDVEVHTPKFDTAITRVWTSSNGRAVVYAEVDGDMLSIARYFRKRRQAKKWVKQRMEEMWVDIFTNCYPVTAPFVEADRSSYEVTFAYDEVHNVPT